jgi:dCMP deaminase
MAKQQQYDQLFVDTALRSSQMSFCTRLQVGAVLVKDNRIIANGWNGTLPGKPNSCECEDGSTSEFVLHAEQNLISYCARKGIPTEGTTLYITHSPCKTCSKLIAAVGITSVIFQSYYKDTDGIEFLQDCNISVTKA